jgi:hypothetical protein
VDTREARADEYLNDVRLCLLNWKTHPFPKDNPTYKVIQPQVKVFGIGGNVDETTATDKPELVYIRPNVSVMSKTTLNLMNPNGWYCLASNTAVMAKVVINLGCKAHLASSQEGVAVLGGGDKGVNVLGKTAVNLVGCGDM